jgi:hypothetical protein
MSETFKRAKCRSCGADVVWARSANSGKWMPLDFEPHEDGTFILTQNFGADAPRATSASKFDQALLPLYRDRWVPHWATCPNADSHRRAS